MFETPIVRYQSNLSIYRTIGSIDYRLIASRTPYTLLPYMNGMGLSLMCRPQTTTLLASLMRCIRPPILLRLKFSWLTVFIHKIPNLNKAGCMCGRVEKGSRFGASLWELSTLTYYPDKFCKGRESRVTRRYLSFIGICKIL